MSVISGAGTGSERVSTLIPAKSWTISQDRIQLSAHDDVFR